MSDELTTKLTEALREIAATDPIEAALDPQRAIRVARGALRMFDELPPLPYAVAHILLGDDSENVFTTEQMHAYARAALEQLRCDSATPAPVEPVAWGMRDKTTGLILDVICPDEHESFEGDYTVPLFAAPVAQAEPRKPLTESALCRQVCEYGPQSEDEETGFRDGFRAAERVHGIRASTKESNQ